MEQTIEQQLLTSCLCTQAQLGSKTFQRWAAFLGESPMHMHRKVWEWCFIIQALYERDMLRAGRRGLGFAVGREPLPASFANYGCRIVATDLFEEPAAKAGWVGTGQHAGNFDTLNERGLCEPQQFYENVTFEPVDMNAIPGHLRNFDFIWSSCSLEHLGSLEQGIRFIHESLKCLRPGGVAVHTTEFNVSSNDGTLERGPNVLYRKRDIERVVNELRVAGHEIDVDFNSGDGEADRYVDLPPYKHEVHLKLQFDNYVSTSIGLLITKGSEVEPNRGPEPGEPSFLQRLLRRISA